MTVSPIFAFRPQEPDADWESVRARVMTALASSVPVAWSDHNAIDPGVTLAEAAAFGLADLHYRTAEHSFAAWPLEVHDWEAGPDRHWHATLPAAPFPQVTPAAAPMTRLAASLAQVAPAGSGGTGASASTAAVLEPLIRACVHPGDAATLLSNPPWDALFTAAERPVVIALMRSRRVRQVAHECTDLVAEAVQAARAGGGPVTARDERAATALAFSLPLWPEELTAVVRRERRRLTAAAVLERLDEIRAATTPAAVTATRAALVAAGLRADEVELAMAAAPTPLGGLPEDFEESDGASRIWPPHPLQSLTCEPVTAADYARRARAHPHVARAWAVRGRLAGIGWDGRATTASTRKGTVTLVVERGPRPPGTPSAAWAGDDDFLREVLRIAIGSEVDRPHPSWRDSFDPLDPRRVICDEVGATLLKTCAVRLHGTLATGVGVDRATTLAGALARVGAYFATGRPESRPTPGSTPPVDGPWPRVDQPATGWLPGEPIRFTEVIQAIVEDPDVLGVEDLGITIGSVVVPAAPGQVAIPADCVPGLAERQCLRVRFVVAEGCRDA